MKKKKIISIVLSFFFCIEIILMLIVGILVRLNFTYIFNAGEYHPYTSFIGSVAIFSCPVALILAIVFLPVDIYWIRNKKISARYAATLMALCCFQIISVIYMWYSIFIIISGF